MSRLSRVLMLTMLLHHIDNVCRPAAPRDVVADAVKGMVERSLSVFSGYAAHRLASLPVDAPRRPARSALPSSRSARPGLPPSRRRGKPLEIEAAPVVPLVIEQVRQYEKG